MVSCWAVVRGRCGGEEKLRGRNSGLKHVCGSIDSIGLIKLE